MVLVSKLQLTGRHLSQGDQEIYDDEIKKKYFVFGEKV